MISFVGDPGQTHGIEPICKVLPIAPSTDYDHDPAARRADVFDYALRF